MSVPTPRGEPLRARREPSPPDEPPLVRFRLCGFVVYPQVLLYVSGIIMAVGTLLRGVSDVLARGSIEEGLSRNDEDNQERVGARRSETKRERTKKDLEDMKERRDKRIASVRTTDES
jgi:hypothetical protein